MGNKDDTWSNIGPEEAGPGGHPLINSVDGRKGALFITWQTHEEKLPPPKFIKYASDMFTWRKVGGQVKVWKQNAVATEPGKKMHARWRPKSDHRRSSDLCSVDEPLRS